MVKHIVFFKLSSTIPLEKRELFLNRMQEIYSPLGEKLDYIKEYRTAINFNIEYHAWDFVIDSVFTNRNDLKRYQDSDEHQEAIRKGSQIEKIKAVIDYEF